MAKKDKKYAAPTDMQAETPATTETSATTETPATSEAAPVSNLPPRKPGLVVEIDGVKYRFDRRNTLPKRAAKTPDGDLKVMLNGVETPAWITSNKGWAKDDQSWIDYIWLNVPEGTPEAPTAQGGFITLDYVTDAKTFAGKEFLAIQGTTERKNPERVGKLGEDGLPVDQKRVESFQAAMAKKKELAAAQAAAVPTEGQSTEQPTEQTQATA